MLNYLFGNVDLFSIYLGAINIAAALVTMMDKTRAYEKGRRIPERTLFTIAILGGAPAMLVTMHLIHHKTKHKRFMLGLPAIIVVQMVAGYIVSL